MKKNVYETICKNLMHCIQNVLKPNTMQFFSVSAKGSDDLVTTIDIAFEENIITQLKALYPNIDILSEETHFTQPKQNTYFTIDPLDGTVNFANHLPLYGIQLAFVEKGITQVAVVYLIPTQEMYYAIRGKGAFCNNQKISVTTQPAKNTLVFMDGNNQNIFANFAPKLTNDFLRVRIIGASCVEFTSIASGNAGGLLLIAKTPWDYIPGCLLVTEAGGYIEQHDDVFICGATQEIVHAIKKYV